MAAYSGMVAWITGAGSGIGRALALEIADGGGDVALSGRRVEKLEEVAAEVTERGVRALVVPCDVTDEAACEAAVATVADPERGLGRIDMTFANAGYGASGRIQKLTAEDWRRQLDVNVVGVANTAKWSLPELEKTKGRLVLVSSVMGMMTMVGQGPYAASKFAVRAIGLTLSQELHGTGVSCTTVFPGFVESDIGRVGIDGMLDPSRVDKRPKNMMWKSDKAAKVIMRAVMSRKREFVFTGYGRMGAFFGRHFPGVIHFAMTRKKTKKRVLSSTKV